VNVPLRLGAKVPNSGPVPFRLGIARMAAMLEAAGFEVERIAMTVPARTIVARAV